MVQSLDFAGRPYWAIKDPVTLKYFHLRNEEYFLLERLNGAITLDELRQQFEREFPPRKLTTTQLQGFVGMLQHEGLVYSESAGQGAQLLERNVAAWKRKLLGSFLNIFSLRFRGLDPEPLFRRIEPGLRWLFSPLVQVLSLGLVLSAAILVVVQWETVYQRLPDFQAFFGLRNVFLLAGMIAVTKILHEFGHALTLRRNGGECPEIGLMLLVFAPCLYCNVSDAWMLPSKWQRAAVSAAGIAVDLVLAAVCTWLWWFSEPGLFNTLCLNVMFVCSVSTLIFNGNPLLRYDGYYLLSDIAEIPNLREQAMMILRQWLVRFYLNVDLKHERLLPFRHRYWLALYGVLAVVYRWVVLLGILWFMKEWLHPYRLDVLADALGIFSIGGALVAAAIQTMQVLNVAKKQPGVSWPRFWVRTAATLIAVGAILGIPFSYPLTAPVLLQPKDATRIYAPVAGALTWTVPERSVVKKGDRVAVLDNAEIQMDVAKLRGQIEQLERKYANAKVRQGVDPEAAAQLHVLQESLNDLRLRLTHRERDLNRLTLVAPAAGQIMPPRWKQTDRKGLDLPTWSGNLLDEHNRGAWLTAGTLVGVVGDPERLEAIAIIDQGDVDLVQIGHIVRLHPDELPGAILTGKVTEISKVELTASPTELSAQGDLPTELDEKGIARPRSVAYQARIALDPHSARLVSNASGWASIYVAPQPLGVHVYRFLTRTFRFQSLAPVK